VSAAFTEQHLYCSQSTRAFEVEADINRSALILGGE